VLLMSMIRNEDDDDVVGGTEKEKFIDDDWKNADKFKQNHVKVMQSFQFRCIGILSIKRSFNLTIFLHQLQLENSLWCNKKRWTNSHLLRKNWWFSSIWWCNHDYSFFLSWIKSTFVLFLFSSMCYFQVLDIFFFSNQIFNV
jgi:hypothetical protein